MGILKADKFRPALFVGLGGNGGKIVNQLAGRLHRHPHWDRISPLTHFMVVDTNKHDLDVNRNVRPDCRFLVSNFDARTYLERKQGQHELEADTQVTDWWPESYKPRPGMTPGAGQIRIESRLKLWYNLEEDRIGFRSKIRGLLDTMSGRENPWRDNEDRVVRVYMYCSVAGGTGSGGFLPLAYLFRQMVIDHGWGRPDVNAILSLPTTFLTKVRAELHGDIAANGYAALKELEYLTRTLGYAGGEEEIPFHWDPGTLDPRRTKARGRPFSVVYLVDRPEKLSIEKYEHAIADASYLQIFSPLLGAQAGEYDNYEKHQRTLAQGHFAVNYGCFGTALLHLPRTDIVRYAALRVTARSLQQYLTFGGDDPEFRVPYEDPAFRRLAEEERNRRIDDSFQRYVAHRAQAEEQQDELGIFSRIHALTGKGGVDLAVKLRESFANMYRRLDEIIDLAPVDQMSVNPGNPSVHRPVANLREDYSKSRKAVRLYLESQLTDLRTGRYLGRLFADLEVDPISQRLLLVRALETAFLTPAVVTDDEEGESDLDYAFLEEAGSPIDFDGEYVRKEQERHDQRLSQAADPGLFKKLTDRDNRAFHAAKRTAVSFVEQLEADCRDDLKRFFWRSFEGEFRKVSETVLSAFRKVAQISDEEARRVVEEAERFRRDPGSFPDSEVAQHYLDAEVLRDDRRRERLWHIAFDHLIDRDAYEDPKATFKVITGAFAPVRDPDGTLRARDAAEIVRIVRASLLEGAQTSSAATLEDVGMDLAMGLDLEQRYIALLDQGEDLEVLRDKGQLDARVRAVSSGVVAKGIQDRLLRLSQECVVLAHLDHTRRDDPTVTSANVFYAGLHTRFNSDEPGALGAALRGVIPGVNLVDDWEERDSLVLYKAVLGIPVYWFKNVQSVLEPAYRKVKNDPRRTYPLHIEDSWENEPGLPNLDPVEIKRAEERRRAEAAARSAAGQRGDRIASFVRCCLFGQVVRNDEGFAWSLAGSGGALGATRRHAFDGLQAVDGTMRGLLEKAASDQWTTRANDRRSREALVVDLDAHLLRLTGTFAAAYAEQDDAEVRFLGEEREVVEALLATLRP